MPHERKRKQVRKCVTRFALARVEIAQGAEMCRMAVHSFAIPGRLLYTLLCNLVIIVHSCGEFVPVHEE